MGPGRAYGRGLNTAKLLVQGSTLYYGVTHGKNHRYPQTHPFIVGVTGIGFWLMMYAVL